MTKKALACVLAGGMILAGMSTMTAAAAENLTLATGGTTGTYYAVGGVMATVLNPVLENSSITVTSTGASKANIQLIDDEDANLGIVQNDVMYYAYSGTDLFEDEGAYDTFAAVAGLYDETVQIVTTDSSIQTVADLAGKTVSVGDAGSGVEFNAKQILAAYDLSFDDIKVVVAGAPTTAVVDLSTVKDISLVQLDEEHIEKLQQNYDFYTKTVIPEGTYTGVGDATTVSVRATLIASVDTDEEVIYELLKAMFDNQEALIAGHAKFEFLNLEDAVKGISVPFHAGAVKYYGEQGIEVE